MSTTPICKCLTENCDVCYNMTVAYCPQSININAGQTPSAQIFLWIRDKLSNLYRELITVNGDGSIYIPLANFPTGMFTPEFGGVNIFITSDVDGNTILPMGTLYPNDTFNCILLSVNNPDYLTTDDGCEFLTDDNNIPLIAQ
jgi:hypothetical protein